MTTKRILAEALKLPRRQRLRIAEQLIDSTDAEEKLLLGAKLAQARLDAVDRGDMTTEPAEEVIAALFARKPKRKS
jgi:hypothetical protein